MNNIREKVDALLKKKKRTKRWLSKETGILEGNLNRVLANVSLDNLQKISKALDVDSNTFLEDNNYSNMNNSVGGYIDHNTPENNLSSMQSVPYEFVQALFEERKRSDEQRIELLRQNGKLIDTLHANKEKNSTAGAV